MSQITNLSVSDGQNFQLALQSKSSTLNFVIIAPFAAFQMVWNAFNFFYKSVRDNIVDLAVCVTETTYLRAVEEKLKKSIDKKAQL
ncbi:hypothetical protein T02_6502 [Trichinella nativa]|uniref:Uncharacterized protein n=1 Tax=Trichinella nativa TaxID=6335 RepID=A0A0V1L0S2_9BILA|nr:hypothetical protein T02_6502 [Trichinella nativa]